MDDVIAVLVSDVHLSAKAPLARSAEPNWYVAMKRPLKEIADLRDEHNCVVCYSGDIFDRWNSPPELINFALKNLPDGFAIPGQHDLPFHSNKDIEKSAYWTLVQSGKLTHIEPDKPVSIITKGINLVIYGFGWEMEIQKPKEEKGVLNLALIHKYIWTKYDKHGGELNPTEFVDNIVPQLAGYKVAAFGDNHKGFIVSNANGLTIVNGGSLMSRNSDQRGYVPRVALLHANGSVSGRFLDVSSDRWLSVKMIKNQTTTDFENLLADYKNLADNQINFLEILRREAGNKKFPAAVREILLQTMEAALEK